MLVSLKVEKHGHAVENAKPKAYTNPDIFIEIDGVTTEMTLSNNFITICSGKAFKLTTNAVGPTYDWFFNSAPLFNTSVAELSVPSIPTTQFVKVRVNGLDSPEFELRLVNSAPTGVTLNSSSSSICSGTNVTLTAGHSGFIDRYEWLKDGVQFNTTSRTVNSINVTTAGRYTVRAVNNCGGTLSSEVVITQASIAPSGTVITPANTNKLICPASTLRLTGSATGSDLTYQWYLNGTNAGDAISGATSATYDAPSAGTYFLIAKNGCGADTTSIVLSSANAPGKPNVNVVGSTISCGNVFPRLDAIEPSLSPGDQVIRYDWYKDGVLKQTSATEKNYITTENGNYYVIAYGTCGGTSSDTIQVKSINPPSFVNLKSTTAPSLGCGVTSFVFSVETDGDSLSYIWKRNNVIVSTNPTYTVTSTGDYQVEVKSAVCDSIFPSAVVNVPFTSNPPTTISMSSPTSLTCDGKITLTANSDGDGLRYIWLRDGNEVDTTITSTYDATVSGIYTVKAENVCAIGPTSNQIALDIKSVPNNVTITASDTLVCGTGTVTLRGDVSGSDLTFEWLKDGQAFGSTQQISVTETGEYTLRVTSAVCGSKEAKQSVKFVTAPSNVRIIPGSVTQVCNPNTPVTLYAQFSGTEGTYEWVKDGVPVGTGSSYDATDAGTYQLSIKNECGTAAAANAINITFGSSLAAPSIIIQNNNGSSVICSSGSVELKASQSEGVVQYRWFKDNALVSNATSEVLTVTEAGEYRVEISKNGCSSLSATQLITANFPPPPVIKYLTPLEFCEGDSVALSTDILDVTAQYLWFLNGTQMATGSSFTVKESGIFKLVVINTCGFSDTTQVETKVTAAPVTEILLNNNILSVLSTNIRKYQWYLDGRPIIGANNATFTPIDSGSYLLRFTTEVGCEGTSNVIQFGGVDVNSNPQITIAPNPTTTGRITVTLWSNKAAQLTLVNHQGKVVYRKDLATGDLFVTQQLIDIGDLQRGIYLLRADFGNGQTITKKVLVL